MDFSLCTEIRTFESFQAFLDSYALCERDLLLTDEAALKPFLEGKSLPCLTVFRDRFGGGEPYDGMVDAVMAEFDDIEIDRVFAIGGGATMDIGKLLVFGNGYSCEELFEKGRDLPKVRKLITVPTTCGTGSEVTNLSIIELRKRHTKLGLGLPQMFPDEAVLIPELLTKLPYGVFATSSIDALIHAIESHVSRHATPYTIAFSREAIRRIIPAYCTIVESGRDASIIRSKLDDMLIASDMAGIAFGAAGCGAVHALSYPVGAGFHVPHGKSNYLLFSACFRMYKKKGAVMSDVEELIASLLSVDVKDVWTALEKLLDGILERAPLEEFGMTEEHLREFPVTVLKTQQRLLNHMPVELTEDEIREIYAECMDRRYAK